MDINVSANMGFGSHESQQNVPRNAHKNSAQSASESASEIQPRTISGLENPWNSKEMSVLIASTQITLNNSLKETLNYLKTSRKNNKKEHTLGELWEELSSEDEELMKLEEIIDYEIDKKVKNIFEAA